MTTEIVLLGTDDANSIQVLHNGEALSFASVTRMVLSFVGLDTVADSDVDASLIDWSAGNGVVTFDLNGLDIDPDYRRRSASLTVYDPDHTNGQVIIRASSLELGFKFRSAS